MEDWRVRDVMTTDVVSIDEKASYRTIVDLLAGCRVSGLPVVDYFGHVTGVISEADLLHRVRAKGRRPRAVFLRRRSRVAEAKATASAAAELMTAPALTVMPGTSLTEAARTMQRRGVRRLPVVDELGRLTGVVTRGDVLRVYLRSDADIRADVEAEVLRRVLAGEPGQVTVAVTDGVVTLDGRVDRRTSAEMAVRLTRAVPGVIDVLDRLGYDFDDGALVRWDPHGHPFDAEPPAPRFPRHAGPPRR